MNKWFVDIFMPSIFERAGVGKNIWLSQKQTAVCVSNMEKHVGTHYDEGGLRRCTHYYFTCEWCGRHVSMSYSKLNGCGSIIFGLNEEEQEKQKREREEEKKRLEIDSIERAKRNPERLAKRIASLKKQEELYIMEVSDKENSSDDIQFFTEKLAECRRLLSLYLA